MRVRLLSAVPKMKGVTMTFVLVWWILGIASIYYVCYSYGALDAPQNSPMLTILMALLGPLNLLLLLGSDGAVDTDDDE